MAFLNGVEDMILYIINRCLAWHEGQQCLALSRAAHLRF